MPMPSTTNIATPATTPGPAQPANSKPAATQPNLSEPLPRFGEPQIIETMSIPATPLYTTLPTAPSARGARHRGSRGEGVISAAIAVLIIAFLGAAMWVAFNDIWEDAKDDIETQVTTIGGSD